MIPQDESGLSDSGERYQRGERIATGGMGEVWRARDTVLGREVAVKILKREFAEDATFRARFEAEARHAAGLHHPGIASVFDYGLLKEGNTPYLVMELVDGKPLSDLLASGQPFDPEQARLLALQIAEALAVAHEAGVVHRDVKPANLLVTPAGRVKITDFGIARATGSVAFTQTGQIVGTPQYLSPEQARGNPATAASDVYSLGIVMFEFLTGRRPFVADTPIATALAQIQQDVPPLPDTVPAALAAVVTRAMAKDPAERYADGGELAEALRGAAESGVSVPPPVTTEDRTQVLPATAAAPLAAPLVAEPQRFDDQRLDDQRLDDQRLDDQPPAGDRSRWPLYAAGLLAVVLLAALLIAHPWTNDGTGTGTPAKARSDTVRVRRAAYIGQPVDEVVAALRAKGLKTTVVTQRNPGGEDAGTVAGLNPTGRVKKGATITVRPWGDPAPDEPSDQPTQSEPDPAPSRNSGPSKSESKAPKPLKTPKPSKSENPAKTAGRPPALGEGGSTARGD